MQAIKPALAVKRITVMHKPKNGFALVIVIWILTLLSLMAGSFALSMRRESSVTYALKNNAQAITLTENGLVLAEFMLQQTYPERRWLVDGSVYQIMRPDGSEIRIRVVSETGKIDINSASQTLLSAVIKAVTGDLWQQQQLLNRILDWRDEDNEPRPHGAEKKHYQDAGLSYIPSNRPFQTLDELQLVLGMDENIFNTIQPWLTVYSGQSDVNLQEAAPEVLAIINNDLNERNIHDASVQQASATAAGQNQSGQNNAGNANNQNRTYTITVEAQMNDGASATLDAVIKFQSQDSSLSSVQVLDWKQNQLKRSLFADEMGYSLITVQDEFTINN